MNFSFFLANTLLCKNKREEYNMIKVLGINGSPKERATAFVVREALKSLDGMEGVETSYISLAGKKIAPCVSCDYCCTEGNWCAVQDDFQQLFEEFKSADAYLIASPVYCNGITPQLAAFFSRMRPLFCSFPDMMRDKFGSAIGVGGSRNGGVECTVNGIINVCAARGINVVVNEGRAYGGAYVWSCGQDADFIKENDPEALENAQKLAKKLAEVTLAYQRGKNA